MILSLVILVVAELKLQDGCCPQKVTCLKKTPPSKVHKSIPKLTKPYCWMNWDTLKTVDHRMLRENSRKRTWYASRLPGNNCKPWKRTEGKFIRQSGGKASMVTCSRQGRWHRHPGSGFEFVSKIVYGTQRVYRTSKNRVWKNPWIGILKWYPVQILRRRWSMGLPRWLGNGI